ncbi:MAG: DNA-directed RNA polymerase subunit beta' [Candidatus Berkelbacteria bacterium]|nr:MAG: DNA-directed RNA polymerase subunit beta' [Candidatus Berkelbacteria bacterium]QQG52076.1 MAG: DNA-directed RNA polymerase subunit beta' [Candidatus Berkelbacteria bacterium]
MAELKLNTRTEKAEFNLMNFEGLRIRVASTTDVERWSYGEVLKPETINYRTQKPERDGLFDERIFGPTKDWECYCGKYKRIRYKGVICDKCGVEVTRASVRRERMGHIDLAVPVSHIWYVRGAPYVMSTLLDISVTDLEKVNYFAGFVIVDVNEELKAEAFEQLDGEFKAGKQLLKDAPERLEQLENNYKTTKAELNALQPKTVIAEGKFHELSYRFGNLIKVGTGAEALLDLLKKVDLDEEIAEIRALAKGALPNAYRRLMKRLRLVTDMKLAGIKAEDLIIAKLPVLPPDLRPMVQLDGGRFASSDLNDLYRRVINRNNRLKRLMNQGAPDVIVRNEKRMLQEAVDALIDNSARKSQTTTGIGRQPRSLSDMLRGKQGRFRQNLLGKRVDYSGRSVIVVGPNLKLDQCGLPKVMALELFKPFVISRLIADGYVHNVKNAARLIERGTPEVWEILEQITKQAVVMLNRAPTLHRLGIQAFRPLLIEGKAIQLHPLVCAAYNADFDGDQMAVHVPLSVQARFEAESLMLSTNNLLKPASGETLVAPRLDIVFGIYYLTNSAKGVKGEGKVFGSISDVQMAHTRGEIHPHAAIQLRHGEERIETTAGRAIFNSVMPEGYIFVNDVLDAKKLKKIIRDIYKKFGKEATAKLADDLMALGFRFAERSGMTMAISDIQVPEIKNEYLKQGEEAVEEITKRYRRGLLNEDERRKLTIEEWTKVRGKIEKAVFDQFDRNSPVWTMVDSGARGSKNSLTQLSGMKGLVVNPGGEIIDIPIRSNYKEGLSVLEYFISTHGSRKGKSDTSLKTADAGYLTRRLVDVAQDLVVTTEDCGVKEGVLVSENESEQFGQSYADRLLGRVLIEPIKDKSGKVLLKTGEEITEDNIKHILDNDIKQLTVRSVLYCKSGWGVCQNCYGRDLATGRKVELGTAVGIMAAQAIGEPGTQLTMKTFHSGGVAHGGDVTSGLPRVEEIFEARPPHNPAIVSEVAGKISIYEEKDHQYVEVISEEIPEEEYELEEGYEAVVKSGDVVKPKQAIATAPDKKAVRAAIGGKIRLEKGKVFIKSAEPLKVNYQVPADSTLRVKSGESVERGDMLTEGHLDLTMALELRGLRDTQKYIIREVQNIYAGHGAEVNEKHIEIIARAMLAKIRVVEGGESTLLTGGIVDRLVAERINDRLKKDHKQPVQYEQIVLGITRASLNTNSFLSAASFQETTSVLIKAAIRGAVDPLKGLKENVIIGKLIPAGTGYNAEPIIEEVAAPERPEAKPRVESKAETE